MTASGTVAGMGYVTLRTHDLNGSITNATDILGLRLLSTSGKKAFLTAADTQHELVLIGDDDDAVDHFGVVVDNVSELDAIREKVKRRGFRIISDGPIEDHIEQGFAFVGPSGFTWQPYVAQSWWDYRGGGIGPDRFGHINYKAVDIKAEAEFLVDVFDMRVSDWIGEDAVFLRCNSDHHGVAVMKDTAPALHHHAWQTQSIVDLGRLGDRIARQNSRLLWGPVRHGAGHNIAAYYQEPSGGVVELYCDMEQIFDRERAAYYWNPEDSYWINQWDGMVPEFSRMRGLGTRPYER